MSTNVRAALGQTRRDSWFAWAMGTPAFLGLFVFLLLPFLLAGVLSLTDQRLLSPNPTQYVARR